MVSGFVHTTLDDDEEDIDPSSNTNIFLASISRQIKNLEEKYFKDLQELKVSVDFMAASYDENIEVIKKLEED